MEEIKKRIVILDFWIILPLNRMLLYVSTHVLPFVIFLLTTNQKMPKGKTQTNIGLSQVNVSILIWNKSKTVLDIHFFHLKI